MNKKRTIIAFIVLSLIMLFSCNTTKKSSDKEEEKKDVVVVKNQKIAKSYIVTTINGKKLTSNNPTLNFDFEKNKINGSTSCNQYGGNIIIDASTIKIERLIATKIYCKDKAAIEKSFTGALSKSHHFKVEKNRFFLYDKADTVLLIGEEKQ